MKKILTITAISLISICQSATIEDYIKKTPQEKIDILKAKPDNYLSNLNDLLKLYTLSLEDQSPLLKKNAMLASSYLVMGLQEAKSSGNSLLPNFTTVDSDAFQHALIASLDSDNHTSCLAALTALTYSSSPTSEMERFLLAKIAVQRDDIAGDALKAMAIAGYNSETFSNQVLDLLAKTTDSNAATSACYIFGHLKTDKALGQLIELASKTSVSQSNAILAIGAYGAKAFKAKPILEKLCLDQKTDSDIGKLAKEALEAIQSDNPISSRITPMVTTNLWPLALDVPSKVKNSTQLTKRETFPPSIHQNQDSLNAVSKTLPTQHQIKNHPKFILPGVIISTFLAILGLVTFFLKKRKWRIGLF
jgi:hypothetical protein